MLWSLIFMSAQIDNPTTSTQKGAPLPATHNEIPHSESVTLTALADGHTLLLCLHASLPPSITTLAGRASSALISGHTVPSENAVTRAPSTKLPKPTDTLFALVARRFDVTSRCNSSRASSAPVKCYLPPRTPLSSFQPQASSGQHLSRYTCRDRNRVNSRRINNIAKNFSIHF
jgi:hypothetical protein